MTPGECEGVLTALGTPQGEYQSCDCRDNSHDNHPDRFVGRRPGEEAGNIRTEGLGGVDPKDQQYYAAHEKSDGKRFVHSR